MEEQVNKSVQVEVLVVQEYLSAYIAAQKVHWCLSAERIAALKAQTVNMKHYQHQHAVLALAQINDECHVLQIFLVAVLVRQDQLMGRLLVWGVFSQELPSELSSKVLRIAHQTY